MVRNKEIASNKRFYQSLMHEFSRDPELYTPFMNSIMSAVVHKAANDTFLTDIHVVEALQRTFDDCKNRMDGKELNKETLLNRIGVVQTAVEEAMFQFKISNRDFSETQVLAGLHYLLKVAENEMKQNTGPKSFIEALKRFSEKTENERTDGLITIDGG